MVFCVFGGVRERAALPLIWTAHSCLWLCLAAPTDVPGLPCPLPFRPPLQPQQLDYLQEQMRTGRLEQGWPIYREADGLYIYLEGGHGFMISLNVQGLLGLGLAGCLISLTPAASASTWKVGGLLWRCVLQHFRTNAGWALFKLQRVEEDASGSHLIAGGWPAGMLALSCRVPVCGEASCCSVLQSLLSAQ